MRLVCGIREDAALREAFFDFVPAVFEGLSFREWYERGCWPDSYRPKAIVDDAGSVLATAASSRLQVLVDGRVISALQLATVGTRPEYRGRGFSRRLLESVLAEARPDDLVFLYGNDTVHEFYPRFGFRRVVEKEFVRYRTDRRDSGCNALRNLRLADGNDFETLRSLAHRRAPVTERFGVLDYAPILLWHALYVVPTALVLHQPSGSIIAMSREGDRAIVHDFLSGDPGTFARIEDDLFPPEVRELVFEFTPEKLGVEYEARSLHPPSDLYVRGTLPLSGDFQFPALART